MRGKIAAYLVTAILIAAVMSAYAGFSLAPNRTLVQTTTTTQTSTSQQVLILTNTLIQTATVTSIFPANTVTITNTGVPSTTTITTVGAPSTTTVTSYYCGMGTTLLTINGSTYCTADVSKETVVGAPGYSYFVNGSVDFMGVHFTTYCPPNYSGCPVPPNTTVTTQTTVSAGAMRFNMTFPDRSIEITGGVIGDSQSVLMLSKHVDPRAGMLITYTSSYGYSVFLLVRYP